MYFVGVSTNCTTCPAGKFQDAPAHYHAECKTATPCDSGGGGGGAGLPAGQGTGTSLVLRRANATTDAICREVCKGRFVVAVPTNTTWPPTDSRFARTFQDRPADESHEYECVPCQPWEAWSFQMGCQPSMRKQDSTEPCHRQRSGWFSRHDLVCFAARAKGPHGRGHRTCG